MSHRKTLFAICLLISVVCLAAGYGITGQWTGVVIATLMGPAWLLARKHPISWLPLVCLLASVGLAVTGILIGCPPLWMIFGSATALAVWDLVLLDAALGSHSSGGKTCQYENKHLQSLVLALGSGLLLTLLGHLFIIQIPFLVLILSVTFTLLAMDRVWSYIKKTGKP